MFQYKRLAILSAGLVWLCGCNPAATTIAVNADGTFTPSEVTIDKGQSIQWTGLSKTDAIVQIGDPNLFPFADPCGIADNDLDHAFAAWDPNEFTGPVRKAVSGIFVLGQDEAGFVQLLSTQACACEAKSPPCIPRVVTSSSGTSYKLCPKEGALYQILDTTWSNPDITGVILRLNWRDIQIDSNGSIVYHWDDLDREMNKAVENGMLFTLDVSAGSNGTPDWIFNTYAGPAPPGPVKPLELKDWGSEGSAPTGSCGVKLRIGSPVDPAYRELYVAMIESLAAHVASDSRWFQALAHVKISGANFLTSEARLPKRCYDGPPKDGMLDTINGDDCVCNSQVWADAGYTPAGLYEYYRVIGNTIYNAFYQRKSMGYQLIQDGFPRVGSSTNFEGENLLKQDGTELLPGGGDPLDDVDSFIQTKTVLHEGDEGRFIDPSGTTTDLTAGKLFVPQHSGLGRLPEDDGKSACSQAQTVNPTTQKADFPIAPGTQLSSGSGSGCPNPFAVQQGTKFSQIMGFQTGSPANFGEPYQRSSSADVESALWNLTINSNGVFLEIYEQHAWEIYHTTGTGAAAEVLDPNRLTLPMGHPAPYSKNLFTWTEELHGRRQTLMGIDLTNPHLRDPFPKYHLHTFSRNIAVPETYYYINPSKCVLTTDPNRVGKITVVP